MDTVTDFISLGSKITAYGDWSHEIKRYLLLGRKAMTNLDSVVKSRDITLLTKVHTMFFPVVTYRCENWTIKKAAAAAAKSLQSCLTLCNPIDSTPPGSSVPEILQARILEWVAISSSNAYMHAKSLHSCPTLCNPMDSSPPGSSVHGIL